MGRKQKFLLLTVASLVVAFGIVGAVYYFTELQPITRYDFYGAELVFRDDLRLAQKIQVYPDENAILNKVWDPDITKISIAYVNSSESSLDNGLVAVNAFEIRYKLDVAYRNPNFNWFNEFEQIQLESLDNVTQADGTLVIVLVPPTLADTTEVRMIDNVVYVKGTTREDFDRATIKFLMASLNITV